jgi:hypothetical protein
MMIIRDELQSARVIDFPATRRDDDHPSQLVIEDYSQWRNPEASAPIVWCCFREDFDDVA